MPFSSRALRAALFFSLVLGGCDCGENGRPAGPCEGSSPLPGCGTACTGGTGCGTGFYCGTGGTCTADCTPTGGQCGSQETCSSTGQCVSTAGDGGSDGSPSDSGNSCQDLSVTADPIKPYILFVIDRSGSMTTTYPCGTTGCESRWDSVRHVLVGGATTGPFAGVTGVIEQYQSLAYIGVVQYTGDGTRTGTSPNFTRTFVGAWPTLIETPTALSNLATIRAAYLAESGSNPPSAGDTPTGESIWTTLCHLESPYDSGLGCASYLANTFAPLANQPAAPAAPLLPATRNPAAPVVFILATDGEPDSSQNPDPSFTSADGQVAQTWSLNAVAEARNAGIKTYVISVAGGTNTENHLAQLACEGGTGPKVTAPSGVVACANNSAPATGGAIVANDTSALDAALRGLVAQSIPCSFQLAGTVNDVSLARSSGQVTVGSTPVALDATNGWWLNDDGKTFTLNGNACTAFRATPGTPLHASFPCGSGVIIIE